MNQDVQVFRGAHVESAHDVAVCVMRDDGAAIFEWGDTARKIYPRSSVKVIQAMPLVMSGAADAFQLDGRMLALACGSHSGEIEHVQLVAEMLARAGLSEADLECGVQPPSRSHAAYDLAAVGEKPSQLHNNCSGKNAGMLLYAKHKGYPAKNYTAVDHPVQRDIRVLLETLISEKIAPGDIAIDGCSIPAYMSSLRALAQGFARLGTGRGLTADQAAAAQRLRAACADYPFYAAGTGRFDTKMMQVFGERAFVKTGAEGVYCGILPELKLGFTLKVLDGAKRAAECVTANLIAALLPLNEGEKRFIEPLCAPVLTNWRGMEVGRIELSSSLRGAMATTSLRRSFC